MANAVSGGATPAVAEPIVTPAAPEAPAVLSPSPEADFQAKARGAKSTTAVRALLNEALKPAPPKPPTPEAPAASEETPATETPETPAGEETPASETPPETPPKGTPETPAGEADDDADQPILDGPVTPSTAKKLRLRLPESDKAGRLAAEFMRRNRDWSMTQALEAANQQLGIKPAAETPPPQTGATPTSGLPETLDAADAAIKNLRAERKKANTELRFEEASDLSDKLEDMLQHRSNIERQSERRETQAVQAYHTAFAASEVQATELYPDAAKPDSAFGKRMKEIDDVLEATEDPRFHAANKPLLCAQMVAAEMNIAPRRKGAPAAPAPKAAVPANGTTPAAPAVPKKGVVPGGASRTTPLVTNQPPAIDAKIKAATTHGELRKVYRELGLRM